MRRAVVLVLFAALALAGMSSLAARAPAPRWWKGNTHTHTLWSDGDGAPELVTAWYREHDYQFFVLSDHNVMLEGERWFPIDDAKDPRLTAAHVDELVAKFGPEDVVVRDQEGQAQMRLHTLTELRARFEKPGEFLMIAGEEITDGTPLLAVHVNGLNLAELIPPQGGNTALEIAQRDLDAVVAQGKRLDRPVLGHLNHPNFRWAFTADDIAQLRSERFFEIYNGHPGTGTYGNAKHPSAERLWDVANTRRVLELHLPLLYGLASDDAHDHHTTGPNKSNCGRGWIVVRAAVLSTPRLIEAMRAGEFYASSGVELADVRFTQDRAVDGPMLQSWTLLVDIRPKGDDTYTTQFIGLRRPGADAAPGTVPETTVLLETSTNPAIYHTSGDELFVRARVTSSRLHPNPFLVGDHEHAWTQPVEPK